MGYRDQKVIRDPRDAKAAQFITSTSNQFRQSIQQGQERKKEEEKKQKKLQQLAQSAVSGRYKELSEYKKTGNKSLDEQVMAKIEEAARAESKLYMDAFGADGTPEMIADYQKLQANNSRDLNDLTMFIGSFDKDVDEAANAINNGSIPLPSDSDFEFDLYVQNNGDVELKKGEDGRYSIFGAGGDFAGKEIPLGKYYDDFESKGTRYEMIDDDYGLVMDEWSKSIIENGDALYKQTQQTGGSTKISTGDDDGGKGTKTPGIKGNVYDAQGYKNDIIKKLKKSNKDGTISSSAKGAPSLSEEQMYYAVRDSIGDIGLFENLTFKDFKDSFGLDGGGSIDMLYSAFADQVIDNGTYRRGGVTDVVATNVTDDDAAIRNTNLIKKKESE